jgi:ATP-dependent RNA helicase DeaD
MSDLLSLEQAPAGLGAALRNAGFQQFTAIQRAILQPELASRDLRISSQTGSGKTVALGLLLAQTVAEACSKQPARKARAPRVAAPVALLIAPTRELAGQLGRELGWLYAPLRARVLVVTGGTSVMQERADLQKLPEVVIGTPGRLLDHLRAGAMTLDEMQALALDEADEMLDMNFEEELDGILAYAPDARRTHLVSATFPREVVRLADRLQQRPVSVQGTVLGEANTDIEHLVMLVRSADRFDAAINVLLRHPDDKTLLFVRTRAQTQRLADALCGAGLNARPLNGEMTQRERNATFMQFRTGAVRYLVATDVAARGLDVQDIGRVVQVDLPDNADVFTHRSGRTGRAGRRGTNVLFAAAHAEYRVKGLLRGAGVEARLVSIPSPDEICGAAAERVGETLLRDLGTKQPSECSRVLAERLLAEHSPEALVASLLERESERGQGTPREVRDDRKSPRRERKASNGAPKATGRRRAGGGDFITYQLSWGAHAGADTRRLLAMVCRRGEVTSELVGAIRIAPNSSTVEISASVAKQFEQAMARPDKRNPRAKIRRWNPEPRAPRRQHRGARAS